jgi:hypothetical protein
VRAVPGSSIPILAPLALHDDAGGIADFDPDTAQAGSIGGIHPWRKSEIFGSQSRVGGNCCSQLRAISIRRGNDGDLPMVSAQQLERPSSCWPNIGSDQIGEDTPSFASPDQPKARGTNAELPQW